MVGPKYVKPTVPLAPEYKEAAPDAASGSAGWRTAQPSDAAQRGEWWTIFGDAELNALEPLIAKENQDLKAADARFRQARALIRFQPCGPVADGWGESVGERAARLGEPALLQCGECEQGSQRYSASARSELRDRSVGADSAWE